MSETALPLLSRLWLAMVCALRVLADGVFAARVKGLAEGRPQLDEQAMEPDEAPGRVEEGGGDREAAPAGEAEGEAPAEMPGGGAGREATPERDDRAALVLLAVLQREGRLVDFLEQDIADFDDAEIGAAARVVHEGCRKALRGCAEVTPVRAEEEETQVVIEAGYAPSEVKLTGDVRGEPPYRGTLRHRGWRVASLALPTVLEGHDPAVVAPAEVEIG